MMPLVYFSFLILQSEDSQSQLQKSITWALYQGLILRDLALLGLRGGA